MVAKGEGEPMTESEALVHAAHFDAELERRNGDVGYGGGRAASV
ncbi:C4-dicarboxylate transport protein [Burkholderia sp. KJ006]|nr:C4-dicarboxylate transport protein [Burkholderia sp. KJ006]